MVQTGPKSQPGGVKKGLFRFAYQVERACRVVKSKPVRVGANEIAQAIISLVALPGCIYSAFKVRGQG